MTNEEKEMIKEMKNLITILRYGTNDTVGLGESGDFEILSIFYETEDRYNHGNLLDRQRQRREEKTTMGKS